MKFNVYTAVGVISESIEAKSIDAAADTYMTRSKEDPAIDAISDHLQVLIYEDKTVVIAEDDYEPEAEDFE
jgi:hypothetical protein